MTGEVGAARFEELAAGLARLDRRLADACAAAGRAREDLTLVAVTKTFPASDARALVELGVRDLGENRDQEASAKALEVPGARWHFVGAVQTNKAAGVARYAGVVHSVDRARLVAALSTGAERAGRSLEVLLQVDLDEHREPGSARAGAAPDELDGLAERVAAAKGLSLRGVMAVAPRPVAGQSPGAARAFARLAAMSERLRESHPSAVEISAGMSGDLEAAIEAGATIVRVGTALLGERPAAGG